MRKQVQMGQVTYSKLPRRQMAELGFELVFCVNAKLILLLPFAKMEGSMRARTGRSENFGQSKPQEKQEGLALNQLSSACCRGWRGTGQTAGSCLVIPISMASTPHSSL